MKRIVIGLFFGILSLSLFSLPQNSSAFEIDLDPTGLIDGDNIIEDNEAKSEPLPPYSPPTFTMALSWFYQQADQHCKPNIVEIENTQACDAQQGFCEDIYMSCLQNNGCKSNSPGQYTCANHLFNNCENINFQILLEPKCKEKPVYIDVTPDDVSWVEVVCGDSKKQGPEECDDGNTLPGDGCDAACKTDLIQINPNFLTLKLDEPKTDDPTVPGDVVDSEDSVELDDKIDSDDQLKIVSGGADAPFISCSPSPASTGGADLGVFFLIPFGLVPRLLRRLNKRK